MSNSCTIDCGDDVTCACHTYRAPVQIDPVCPSKCTGHVLPHVRNFHSRLSPAARPPAGVVGTPPVTQRSRSRISSHRSRVSVVPRSDSGASRPPADRSPIRRLGTPTRGSPPHERSRRSQVVVPGRLPGQPARRDPRQQLCGQQTSCHPNPHERLGCHAQPWYWNERVHTQHIRRALGPDPSRRRTPPDAARTCRCEARICSASA